MERLMGIIDQFAGTRRAWHLAEVVDVSLWSVTGPSFVLVEIGNTRRLAVYRDGRVPVVGEKLQVIKMNDRADSYWLALPLPVPEDRRKVAPLVIPAFDNRWHVSESGAAPADTEFAAILGRRDDNTWEIRSYYPMSEADYASIYGGSRIDMTVRMGASGLDAGAFVFVTWAHPDFSPSGGGIANGDNAYYSSDDGVIWTLLTTYPGVVDLNEASILWNGGNKLSQAVGGGAGLRGIDLSPDPDGTFALGEYFTHLCFNQIPFVSDPSGVYPHDDFFWFFLLNEAGLSTFKVTRNITSFGGTYTFTGAIQATYSPPTPSLDTQYGRLRMWFPSGTYGTDTRLYWYTSVDHEGTDAGVAWCLVSDLVAGTPTWTVDVAGASALTTKVATGFAASSFQDPYDMWRWYAAGVNNGIVGSRPASGAPTPWYRAVDPTNTVLAGEVMRYRGQRNVFQPFAATGSTANRNTGLFFVGPAPYRGSRYDGSAQPRLLEIVMNTGVQTVNTGGTVRSGEGDLRSFDPGAWVPYGDNRGASLPLVAGAQWWKRWGV